MRTNIEIDDRLMRQLRSSGARTKRAVVEETPRLLIQTRGQASVRGLRGTVSGAGDLSASRRDRLTQ